MKIPFFALFIVFVIWLTVKLKISTKQINHSKEAFLEKETLANETRKQPIDNLNYIQIPLDTLPFSDDTDEQIEEYQNTIKMLASKKILNLTGQSNTDLKLQYGAANLEALSSYDANFTELARSLYKWGEALYKKGLIKEAKQVLEFGIKCNTDISGHYYLLAQIYTETDEANRIEELIQTAEQLNSLLKNTIVKRLTAMLS